MPKVSIIPLEKTRTVAAPPACSGSKQAKAYLDSERSPLHLHLYEIAAGQPLRIEQNGIDHVIYIWRGSLLAGGHLLAEGSSVIVEHGRALTMKGDAAHSLVLVFAAADASHQSRPGGNVHLMPVERVPRTRGEAGSRAAVGGMHANSECPTCQVWLHENTFPGVEAVSKEEEVLGIHSHTEDEIIFVTDGQIRLGSQLHGPGTALAIAANTLYGFTAGAEGLRFVNFRAGRPGDIRFASGNVMNETAYWRDHAAQPEYVEVIPDTALQLRSILTEDGQMELSLAEVPVTAPASGEVLIRVEGAPINPTDLAVLVSPADLSHATLAGSPQRPLVRAPCLPGARERYAARVGKSLTAGLEGAGVVVAAGAGAEALLGQTVAVFGGAMYSQYAVFKAERCLAMPDGVTPAQAASSFVNPMTALAMVETARQEGHSAIVHTAAASNLGIMLHRICKADGMPLVNIVRRPEQAALLRAESAQYICDSSAPEFREQLIAAIRATDATLAFDAIGGGRLIGEILSAMEIALKPTDGTFDIYGNARHKQAYVYGSLDPSPTELSRTFGMAWGICGWLLMPVLHKLGAETTARLRARVAAEITTTFASHYTAELSLAEVLNPQVLAAANRKATGEKFLVNPSKL